MKYHRIILRYFLFFVALLFLVLWTYTSYVSRSLYSYMRSELHTLPEIASKDQALTFARTKNRLLLVTGLQSRTVKAIDLSEVFGADVRADPIGLYKTVGYDSLAALAAPVIEVDIDDLQLPLDFSISHLAAGTNYKEHSEEVMLDDPPFLFPKYTQPTPWNSPVRFTKRLDYEAELAMVPLSDIHEPDQLPAYGLILANDFTDRWTLIKGLNLRKPMGTTGFAAAKGQESFLPAGHFLVIPKDQNFYRKVELRLFVNDRLRQRFTAGEMILDFEEIAEQAFVDLERIYRNGDSIVDLIPKDGIERGSMVLTGTAGGVIFKPVNIWSQGPYLKEGDVVRVEASYLGYLENVVRKFR